jgi:hypothetical protein
VSTTSCSRHYTVNEIQLIANLRKNLFEQGNWSEIIGFDLDEAFNRRTLECFDHVSVNIWSKKKIARFLHNFLFVFGIFEVISHDICIYFKVSQIKFNFQVHRCFELGPFSMI